MPKVRPMLRRLVVVLALVALPAVAEEPNLLPVPETMPGALPGAASRLILAERVYREATRMGDPVLLLSAIRLARGVTLRPAQSWARTGAGMGTGTGTGEAPAEAGSPGPESSAALTMLRGLAVDDPDLQDLVYDLDAQLPQGRLPVATVARAVLAAGAVDEWRVPLSGAVAAEIAAIGDAELVLGLTVTDEGGATVCARPATTDPALCRFTPARNGFFTVRISNAGAAAGGYLIVGN